MLVARMKITTILLVILCSLSISRPAFAEGEWRFPGEFEAQELVWMGWLSKEYIKGFDTDAVLLEMAENISKHVKLRICVPNKKQKDHVLSLLKKYEVDQSNISFYVAPFSMLYWRDFGPIFTVNAAGQKSIADFNFNCWGYFPDTDTQARMMERVDRDAAKAVGLPSRMTRLVSEGGDRELNGKGTILVTEACEFQRNPNLSREDIEHEFAEMLGATNVIWLKKGTVDDDPYNTSTLPGPDGKGVAYRSAAANNHVDEYCRFITPNTILLAEVSEKEAAKGPVERENRRRMEENYEILKKARDQDGKPFKIIRIPMPETLFFTAKPDDEAYFGLMSYPAYTDGTTFPFGKPVTVIPAQSYCNFLITNGLVLAQKYWMEGMPESVKKKDEEALAVLKNAFSDREVVAINTLGINFGGGGIHCSTQQEPAGKQ
ncbi:agmatine deiminase family protein [Desulfovibrio inopinatus]|uniref:agmatine deiminase family protein n=1 Tax=Desulfovibrio inopinatus TaxID=102109 RepID=UPI0003F8E1EA|nr:agmatine deiminase family protein [Desulfovibrio inopinatus]